MKREAGADPTLKCFSRREYSGPPRLFWRGSLAWRPCLHRGHRGCRLSRLSGKQGVLAPEASLCATLGLIFWPASAKQPRGPHGPAAVPALFSTWAPTEEAVHLIDRHGRIQGRVLESSLRLALLRGCGRGRSRLGPKALRSEAGAQRGAHARDARRRSAPGENTRTPNFAACPRVCPCRKTGLNPLSD